jgi:hypothetical protein
VRHSTREPSDRFQAGRSQKSFPRLEKALPHIVKGKRKVRDLITPGSGNLKVEVAFLELTGTTS